jgi:hypothetical protein
LRRCSYGDAVLAQSLADGFDALWNKALADLREIRSYPSAQSRVLNTPAPGGLVERTNQM